MECPRCTIYYTTESEIDQIRLFGLCSSCENEEVMNSESVDEEYEEDY